MRISDEKLNHLSHVLTNRIEKTAGIELPRGKNPARLRILALLNDGAQAEESLHERIRQKMASGKRQLPEGSHEWEILYRRYYDEEMARLLPPATGR